MDDKVGSQKPCKMVGHVLSVSVLLLSTGCHHNIRFEDIGYSIEQKKSDAGLVAVITPETFAQGKQINSIMTGAIHTWEARPGEMLSQIAEVEFPQLFAITVPHRISGTKEGANA